VLAEKIENLLSQSDYIRMSCPNCSRKLAFATTSTVSYNLRRGVPFQWPCTACYGIIDITGHKYLKAYTRLVFKGQQG
jgi:hypothetical protein